MNKPKMGEPDFWHDLEAVHRVQAQELKFRRYLRANPGTTWTDLREYAKTQGWDTEKICLRMFHEARALAFLDSTDLAAALALAEKLSHLGDDGHFTLMKFGSGWKAVFGTPDLSHGSNEDSDYVKIAMTTPADTAAEAICLAVIKKFN